MFSPDTYILIVEKFVGWLSCHLTVDHCLSALVVIVYLFCYILLLFPEIPTFLQVEHYRALLMVVK